MRHVVGLKGRVFGVVGVVVGAMLVFTSSCKHEPPVVPNDPTDDGGGTPWVPPPDTGTVVTCDPDTVYFQQTILPLVVNFCATSGCHNSISHRHNVRLYNYTFIRQQVSPGHPSSSDLYTTMLQSGEEHMPPTDHPQMSAEQRALINSWIMQGASNNSCEPTACDTANVTYAATIQPFVANMCTGCHSGSSPDGGIDLSSYNGLHAVAIDGRLAGSIQHQASYSAMPPVGSGLSDCHIQQVLKWIEHGEPAN
jgi:cytochrome c553